MPLLYSLGISFRLQRMQRETQRTKTSMIPSSRSSPLLSLCFACLSNNICRSGQKEGKNPGNKIRGAIGLCLPRSPIFASLTSLDLCFFFCRLPWPHWLHIHEPISSLAHREANGQPPQLHGHPSECPTDTECCGDSPQCPRFTIPSHHLCHGSTLRSLGSASRHQLGGPAQLSGRCYFSPRLV